MTTEIKPKYVICDLDGCLIDTGWIWDFIKKKPIPENEAFDLFNRLANADTNKIDLPLYKYLCFKGSGGCKIHFLTSRSEAIEVETINFIQKKTGLVYGNEFTISFRPSGDLSSPAESKASRIMKFVGEGKSIEVAIDDEDDILKMYESKGIPCMKWIIGFIPVQVVAEYSSQINNLINVKEELCQN